MMAIGIRSMWCPPHGVLELTNVTLSTILGQRLGP
jgi:hypothetical protein